MELFLEILKMILPAGIVLYAAYLMVKVFIKRELDRQILDVKSKNREVTLPMRIQAYERICLFLERISPIHLLPRLNENKLSAQQYQHTLIQNIREEYNHNFSQQIYMSDKAWEEVKSSVEELIALINSSYSTLAKDAGSIDLAKRIFGELEVRGNDPVQQAIFFIKQEIRKEF